MVGLAVRAIPSERTLKHLKIPFWTPPTPAEVKAIVGDSATNEVLKRLGAPHSGRTREEDRLNPSYSEGSW